MKFTTYTSLAVLLIRAAMAADSSSATTTATSTSSTSTSSTTGSTTTLESSSATTTGTSSATTASTQSSTDSSTTRHSTASSALESSTQSTVSSTVSSSATTSTDASSSTESTITSSASSNDDSMPTITATSSSSSTFESSSYNVTFSAVVPTGYNPYVIHETLPTGLTFIIIGAILGSLLFSLIVARFFWWCSSYRAAKKTSDTSKLPPSDYNYDPSIFKEASMKQTFAHSIYSISSQSTLNVLGSNASMDNLVSQAQGRSYRSAVTRASRTSLFISPTEMLALGNLDNGGYLSNYDSPIESPTTATGNYSPKEYKRKPSRPPSMYMEKLLDDDLDDLDVTSDSFEFDPYADEKV